MYRIDSNSFYNILSECIKRSLGESMFEGHNGHSKGSGLDSRKLAKILRKNGFEYVRSNGDHDYYRRPNDPNSLFSITVPYMNRMIWRRMCKEHDINTNI